MQVDWHVSVGTIVTWGTIIFVAGGAWVAIKNGIEDGKQRHKEFVEQIKGKMDEAELRSNQRLDAIVQSIREIHSKYLLAEVDAAREKGRDKVLEALEKRLAWIENHIRDK